MGPYNVVNLAILYLQVISISHGSLTKIAPNLGFELESISPFGAAALKQILGGSRIVNHRYFTNSKNPQYTSDYATSVVIADHNRAEANEAIVAPSHDGHWVGTGGAFKGETSSKNLKTDEPTPVQPDKPVVFPSNKEELSFSRTSAEEEQKKAQKVTLYTGPGQVEVNVDLIGRYCPDLRKCFEVSLDDAVSSVKLTGIWVFFAGYSYGLSDELDVEWGWGEDYTHDFQQTSLNNNVSSVRFIGHASDSTADSLTLFSGKFFKAWEFFAADSQAVLGGWPYQLQSAAVTGKTPWTLYEFENYQGLSKCLYPWRGGSPGLYPVPENIGMTIVRSVRKGCFSTMRGSPTGILANEVPTIPEQKQTPAQPTRATSLVEEKNCTESRIDPPTFHEKEEKQPAAVKPSQNFFNIPFLPQIISPRIPVLPNFLPDRALTEIQKSAKAEKPAAESTNHDSTESPKSDGASVAAAGNVTDH